MKHKLVGFVFLRDVVYMLISCDFFTAGGKTNMVTNLYTLTMNGRDDDNCLHQQANCKTIGFILENECHSNVNLAITMKYQQNYTHEEPCRKYNQNISNLCSVTIYGEDNSPKPILTLEQVTDQACVLFQSFTASNQTSRNDSWICSEHHKHKHKRPVLRFEYLIVSSSILDFHGQLHFSADNVDFVDSQVNMNGLSIMPCSFHCSSCTFSMSTNAQVGRTKQRLSQITLSHCLVLSFELYHCFVSSTTLNLSFLYVGCVHGHNMRCDNETSAATAVQILQLRAPPLPEQSLPQSIVTFENILLFSKRKSGHTFVIELKKIVSTRSEVFFVNCTSAQSAGLLKYTVLANRTTANSVHKLSVSDTYVADSEGSLIQIQNTAGGIFVFARCVFSGNVAPKASPLIYLSVTKALVFLIDTKLNNNIGGFRIFEDDARTMQSLPRNISSNMSDTLKEKGCSFHTGIPTLSHVYSSFIQVCNCTFVNSQSEVYAGGLSIQIRGASGLSIYRYIPLFVQIKDSLFQNLTSTMGNSGAIEIYSTIKQTSVYQYIFGSIGQSALRYQKLKTGLLISGCTFMYNSGKNGGAILFHSGDKWSFFLVVRLCYFEGNTGRDGGAIKIHDQCSSNFNSFVAISFSKFSKNVATGKGSAISTNFVCSLKQQTMKFSLTSTVFSHNIVQEKALSDKGGGALLFDVEKSPTTTIISFKETTWENNTSTGHGGALALHIYESSSVHITKSHFISNSAGLTSFGGACYFNVIKLEEIGIGLMIQINQSVFHNNIAAEGGSVFQTSSLPLDIKFGITDSVFHCCDRVDADFVSITASTHFKNVQFYYVLATDDLLVPVLLLKHQGPYLLDNVYFTCYLADITLNLNSISTLGGVHYVTNLTSLSASCTKCTTKPFPKGNGTLSMDQGSELSYLETNVTLIHTEIHLKSPCKPCPFGGECLDNTVKALPNYWGFKYKESIEFFPCPLHYCCNGIDMLCDHTTHVLHSGLVSCVVSVKMVSQNP